MAENLNYAPSDISDMGSFAWSGCYNDDPENCEKYGRLYTWEVAMNNAACAYGKKCSPSGVQQGICPEGWHLPSNSDWSTLWTAVGGTSTAGTKLKSTSGWDSNGNGADNYGFSVLPAGDRDNDGSFSYQGSNANFWSSSEYDSVNAWNWSFYGSLAYVGQGSNSKDYGFSVRCLKD
ncbi:MAG: fibrobacter succinogenes major paralogous domain-containing protein [Fibrobacter sp.]|nr:fibrobacter succinogenes major paralogous domain-containing protein [Fibrobacter sp.]